jgi:predicted nucleotidyltransferase
MSLGETVVAAVSPHPAVRQIELVGSRAEGRETPWSDWDFGVRASDFAAVADALPQLLAPLEPLVQQWDRLSSEQCWMLILPGPAKVDLIFPEEAHAKKGPWRPAAATHPRIDDHFWDRMLWLRGKEAAGKSELVGTELQKLFGHLLAPLGAGRAPASIADAVAVYRAGRDRAERSLGTVVSRRVELAVAPALENGR